jgi:hypothetical protein
VGFAPAPHQTRGDPRADSPQARLALRVAVRVEAAQMRRDQRVVSGMVEGAQQRARDLPVAGRHRMIG